MGGQVHRFGNLIFDLDVFAAPDSYHSALDRARDLYMQQVLPHLEVVLDEVCPPELVVELDSLEIDLGDIGGTDWEAEFVEKCLERFASQVKEKLAGVREGHQVAPEVTVKTSAVWKPEMLVRYLETGSFGAATSGLPPARELLLELLESHPQSLVARLVASHDLRNVARRLVYQFPMDRVARLRSVLLAEMKGNPKISEWITQLDRIVKGQGMASTILTRSLLVTEIWVLLDELGINRGHQREEIEEFDVVSRFFMEAGPNIAFKRKKIKPVSPDSLPENRIAMAWEAVSEALQKQQNQGASSHSQPKKKTPEVTAELLGTKRLADANALPVANAGIVLLNPFIQALFEHLGWVQDGEFRDPEAQYRGVYLLHYLATYADEAEEVDLALPKLICGLAIAEPIYLDVPLTGEENEAATELLMAVIGHWPEMEGSSPEALQEAFLRRAGTLEQGGTGSRLRVEAFMLDVLLARLPWGLSIMHYPWMEGLLYVEWG